MSGIDTVSAAFGSVSNNSASYIETTETNEFWTTTDDKIYNLTASSTLTSTLFELTGISNTTGITPADSVVTVDKINIASGASKVALSGDSYSLKLSGVALSGIDTVSAAFGSVSNNSASYIETTETNEFWTTTDDKIYNLTASSTLTSTLFELTGISNTTGITPADSVVTVDKINIATGASKVALSGDSYKLQLSGVSLSGIDTVSAAFGSVSNNSASYIETTETNEFWTTKDDKTYNLTASSTLTSTLFELTGISNTTGITPADSLVTVDKSNIAAGASKVALSGDSYSLKLSGVSLSGIDTVSAAFGSVSNNSASYIETTTTNEFWTTTDDKIYNLTASSTLTSTLFTLDGITAIDDNALSGTTVTLGRDNLSTMNATLTNKDGNSFKLALAAGTAQSIIAEGFTGNVYKAEGKTDGYTIGSNTVINYIKASGNENLFSVSSVNSTNNVKYTANSDITATNETSAQLSMGSALNDSTLTIDGFVKISGFNATNHSLNGTPTDTAVDGKDLILITADGSVTISDASTSVIKLTDSGKSYTAEATQIADITNATAKSVTLTAGFTADSYTFDSGTTILDASKVTNAIAINAAAASAAVSVKGSETAQNTIFGSAYDDTLIGGMANDSIRGGKGKDLFVQTTGTDTVIDYTEGEDVINLLSAPIREGKRYERSYQFVTAEGTVIVSNGLSKNIITKIGSGEEETTIHYLDSAPTNTSVKGSDLIITAGDKNYTVTGAAADTVKVVANGNDYTAEATRITDLGDLTAKSVTLTTGFADTYYGLSESYAENVTAVDATNANTMTLNLTGIDSEVALKLTGADKAANTLTGGAASDTLTGGSNNDVLTGNDGADLFVQSGGTDTISDYTGGEDLISLNGALTGAEAAGNNVTLKTAAGSIVVENFDSQIISTQVDDKETELLVANAAPTNTSVKGHDLIITVGDKEYKFAKSSADTIMITANGKLYTADAKQIVDITDATAKSVTLTTGFKDSSYTFEDGITVLDASKVKNAIEINASTASAAVSVKGSETAQNTIFGSAYDDTLIGGKVGDSIRGGKGKDLFVQTADIDTVIDYTEGDDVIQFISAPTKEGKKYIKSYYYQNAEGTVIVSNGLDKNITTKVGKDGEELETYYLDSAPIDTSVNGGNLVVITETSKHTLGAADDTVTVMAGDRTYTADVTQIVDITDETAKSVTLTASFTADSYKFEDGTTALDASKVKNAIEINASTASAAVSVKGSETAQNTIFGSAYDDTLIGGKAGDSIRGGKGKDLFVQTAGTDTVIDYAEGDDVIQFISAPTKEGKKYIKSYYYQNAEGTIIVSNGLDKNIKTKVGEDGKEMVARYLDSAPINTSVNGGNLVVTTEKDKYTLGASGDTVTIVASNSTYTAEVKQIVDITDETAKGVTLTSGFTANSYTFDSDTTVLDASKVTNELTISAAAASAAVSIKGSETAKNIITGSTYDDTLVGGKADDSIRGGKGKDLFVQTAGTDTVIDYTEGDDTIQLLSKPTREGKRYTKSYQFVTEEGTVIVNNGLDKNIKTVVGGGSNDVATFDDELWGVSGKQDILLFDGGNDTVHNYEANDVIDLNGYLLSDLSIMPAVSGNNLVFTFDKANSLTISDIVDSGTPVTFSDGTTYSSDGKKYTKK